MECLKQFGEDKVTGEIVEKKSKFIANLFYVKSEEQAQEIIKATKKQYFDARHNCYAYRIINENNTIVERQSDDGEPSGTAGAPLLNILSKNNLCNVLVIVTRYFGGILLGTGGLVRAYSDAAMDAIEKATLTNEIIGIEVEVEIEYADLEKMKYFADKNSIRIVNTDYQDTIKCYIETPKEILEKLLTDNKVINYKIIKNVNIRC